MTCNLCEAVLYETNIAGAVDSMFTKFRKQVVVEKLITECNLVTTDKSSYYYVTLKFSVTLSELII